jgi:hypothetical protein
VLQSVSKTVLILDGFGVGFHNECPIVLVVLVMSVNLPLVAHVPVAAPHAVVAMIKSHHQRPPNNGEDASGT